MPKESLPIKGIFPPHENPEVTERKYDTMLRVLKGEFKKVNPNIRPTILDFQGLNPDAKEKDFIHWIEVETGIKPEDILEDGEGKESAESYRLLNYAYQQAKDFLRDTLKYDESELDKEPRSINSKKQLFDLLGKTRFAKGGKGSGLSRNLIYCRLVKATIATFETLKHDAKLVAALTENFESALISRGGEGDSKSTPLVALEGNGGGKRFYAEENSDIHGVIATRAKKFQGMLLKFITRPASNAERALVDGIGCMITVSESQAMELVPILCRWLSKEMGVNHMNLQNNDCYSKEFLKNVEPKLLKVLSPSHFNPLAQESNNPTSSGEYRALYIRGEINKPLDADSMQGSKPISPHARQFEIQLVLPENENEKGRNNHNVYDVVKRVTARTRLDGWCPAEAFEKFVEDASEKSGMSTAEIKGYLLKPKNPGDAPPIVQMPKSNGRVAYVANSVYDRWNKFGWIDRDVSQDIADARN